jgi:SM-20-related protein
MARITPAPDLAPAPVSTRDAAAASVVAAVGRLRLIDLRPFLAAPVAPDPYPHLLASGCVRPEALPALRRDFPDLRKSGFHTTDAFAAQGAFAELLDELSGPEVAAAMSAKFGIDFARCRG